jgi:pheromone shutdown protein TraB
VARNPADNHTSGRDQIDRLWSALDSHLRRRDAHDQATTPRAPSLTRVYWTGAALLATAAASLLLSLKLFVAFDSWWLRTVSMIALTGAGLAAHRLRSLRLFAAAWLTGLAGSLVAVGTIVVHQALS